MNTKNEKEKNLKTSTISMNEFIEEELEKNIEQASYLTSRNCREIYEIIEQNGDNQEGKYYLREREICFKETLRVLNHISFHLSFQQEV